MMAKPFNRRKRTNGDHSNGKDVNGNISIRTKHKKKESSGFLSTKSGKCVTAVVLSLVCTGMVYQMGFISIGSSGVTKEQGKNYTAQSKKSSKSQGVNGKESLNQGVPREAQMFKATTSNSFGVKKITINGRQLEPVALTHNNENSTVRAFMFENFLSELECEGLMRAHIRHVNEFSQETPLLCFDTAHTLRRHLVDIGRSDVKVTMNDFTSGTTCLNSSLSQEVGLWMNKRWSYSTAFYPGESKFSHTMGQWVQDATGLAMSHGGKFQITSYAEGIGYKTHTDCTVDGKDQRDRFATILVYLTDVKEGGETEFPELGFKVTPKKGRALVWTNMRPDGSCDPTSIHQAAKVKSGHKFILQRWYYYKNFYSLGKRPPEPKLPERRENTARVTCDEYEHGSCRWYDEWNYEHIMEYRLKQHTLI